MIIEWHTHVYPPRGGGRQSDLGRQERTGWGGRCPTTVENVLDAHHKAGIDVSLVSNAAHYLRGKADKEEFAAIRRWTDYAAEIQDTYKGTLYGLAILPCGGPAYLKEVERAIVELSSRACSSTEPQGALSDDDEARPFWSWCRISTCR